MEQQPRLKGVAQINNFKSWLLSDELNSFARYIIGNHKKSQNKESLTPRNLERLEFFKSLIAKEKQKGTEYIDEIEAYLFPQD